MVYLMPQTLLAVLGLHAKPTAAPAANGQSFNEQIPSLAKALQDAVSSANEQITTLKWVAGEALRAIDPSYSVASIGGSWTAVDNLVTELDYPSLVAELSSIAASTGEMRRAKFVALRGALAIRNRRLAIELFEKLDNPPFAESEGNLRVTLANPIDEIMKQIARAEASEQIAPSL
jgi:hypothetical protein